MKCKIIEESRFLKMKSMEDVKGGITCSVNKEYSSCSTMPDATIVYTSCKVASLLPEMHYSGSCSGAIANVTLYTVCSGRMQYDTCVIGSTTDHNSCGQYTGIQIG